MSQNEIKAAINNAECSLKMEGLSVDAKTKILCEKLLTNEITLSEYISFVKQKAGVTTKWVIVLKRTEVIAIPKLPA